MSEFLESNNPAAFLPGVKLEIPVPPGQEGSYSSGADPNKLRARLLDLHGDIRSGALPITAPGGTVARTAAQRAGDVINVKDFGAVGDDVTDDYAALAAAIAYAGKGREVYLPAGKYVSSGTLTLLSGQKLVGAGFHRDANPTTSARIPGTQLRRAGGLAAPLLNILGTPIATGPQHRSVEVRGLRIHGGDNVLADCVSIRAGSMFLFEDVQFTACRARALYAEEFFDSRFINCSWDDCGHEDGVRAAVELASVVGQEYTNQIHFIGCRWESYRGVALATTGLNTNEVFFTSCKFESLSSNLPALDLSGANVVHFGGVTVTSKGTLPGPVPALVRLANCKGVLGTLMLEHLDSGNVPLTAHVSATLSSNLDLTVYVYGGATLLTGTDAVTLDGATSTTSSVRGSILSKPAGKRLTNQTRSVIVEGLLIDRDGEPQTGWLNRSVSTTEVWTAGRVVADSTGTRWRLVHGTGSGETAVLEARNDNTLNAPVGLRIGGGRELVGYLSNSGNWNPGAVAAGASVSTTLTVTGALAGDPCTAGYAGLSVDGWTLTAYVESANTVRVRLRNDTAGSLTPASATLRVGVWRH